MHFERIAGPSSGPRKSVLGVFVVTWVGRGASGCAGAECLGWNIDAIAALLKSPGEALHPSSREYRAGRSTQPD